MRHIISRTRPFPIPGLILIIFLFLLSGCAKKPEGYGVVYWSSDEETVETGSMYPVLRISTISNTYVLDIEGFDEGLPVDSWRLAFFEKEEEAAAEKERYSAFQHLYAVNGRDRLAMRETPDIASSRVYVLRLGQELKVLERIEEKTSVGQHEGYWYRLLTEDGVTGYSFDQYLEVYDHREGPVQTVSPELTYILEAFARVYRPEYYREMIREDRVVLERFAPRFGFFPYPGENRLEVHLPGYSKIFTYQSIEPTGARSYVFTGSGLSLNFFGENSLAIAYLEEGRSVSERFTYISDERVNEAVERERQKREKETERFAGIREDQAEGERGENGNYRSSAYGTLTFLRDGTFRWEGKQRLVPELIPEGTGDTGRISFDHFPDSSLSDRYQGVVNFTFTRGPSVLFLYTLGDDGLRLTTIDPRSVEKRIVGKAAVSPLVMAFRPENL
jgi:hypothetical protein